MTNQNGEQNKSAVVLDGFVPKPLLNDFSYLSDILSVSDHFSDRSFMSDSFVQRGFDFHQTRYFFSSCKAYPLAQPLNILTGASDVVCRLNDQSLVLRFDWSKKMFIGWAYK